MFGEFDKAAQPKTSFAKYSIEFNDLTVQTRPKKGVVDDHVLRFPKDFKHRTRTSSCFSFGCGDRVAKGYGHCVVIVFYHNELFLLSLRDHVQILSATHIIFWSQG